MEEREKGGRDMAKPAAPRAGGTGSLGAVGLKGGVQKKPDLDLFGAKETEGND